MRIFVLISLFLSAQSLHAQLAVDWYKNSSEVDLYHPKQSVYNPVDSCIYTAGMFSGQFEMDGLSVSSGSPKAFFLMKTRGNGEIVWLKKIAENDYTVELTSQVALSSGASGALLLGITFNRKLFFGADSTILPDDPFTTGGMLFKLDTAGAELWSRQVFTSTIQGIAVNGNEEIFLTGRTLSDDVYLTAYSQPGDSLWTRTGGSTNGFDEGKTIETDSGNNIYVLGQVEPGMQVYFDTEHPVFVNPYFRGSFLAKYDPSGMIQWIRCFYSENFGDYVTGQSITLHGNNVFVIGGYKGGLVKFSPVSPALSSPDPGLTKSFILCYDPAGTLLWRKLPHKPLSGGVGLEFGEKLNGLFVCKGTFSGSFIVAGDTLSSANNELFLEAFDTLGNSIWHRQIKGSNPDVATAFFRAEADLILNVSTKSSSLLLGNTTMTLAPVSDQMVLIRLDEQTLSVPVNQAEDFSIFPNPANGTWNIRSVHDVSGKNLQIFSISGELVHEQILANGNAVQNTPLAKGTYLVRIAGAAGKPVRLVIQ